MKRALMGVGMIRRLLVTLAAFALVVMSGSPGAMATGCTDACTPTRAVPTRPLAGPQTKPVSQPVAEQGALSRDSSSDVAWLPLAAALLLVATGVAGVARRARGSVTVRADRHRPPIQVPVA